MSVRAKTSQNESLVERNPTLLLTLTATQFVRTKSGFLNNNDFRSDRISFRRHVMSYGSSVLPV